MIPVECYLALSALLFFIGVYGFVTRRNLIAMLISVELVLNAVDINFAAISQRNGGYVHDALCDWCCRCRKCCGHRYYYQRLPHVQERQC